MNCKFLPLLLLPILGMAQANSNGEVPNGGNTASEKLALEMKRNAQYNLEEIKVRWKKAALENCPGVPCITAMVPGSPTGVVATVGSASASASVAFTAPTNTGGSTITGYTVTSSPGSITGMGTTSPINVTGLTNGTAYTFTVVATNAVGSSAASAASTAVTPAAPFLCGTSTVPDNEGNTYNTVSIGTQCWMAENLKVTKYNNGTLIPDETASTAVWTGLTTGARSDYTGAAFYIPAYGYLYNWYAATDSRKICPTGWHVPTDSDWNKLVKSIDSGADTSSTSYTQSTIAGSKMKSTSTLWNIASPASPGTNTSGFSALPGGVRYYDNFVGIGSSTSIWSVSVHSSGYAYYRDLNGSNSNVVRANEEMQMGASVRCLKD